MTPFVLVACFTVSSVLDSFQSHFQIVLRIRNVKPQTKGQSFLLRIFAKTGIQDVPGICLFSYILLLITFSFQRTPGSHRAWAPCGEIFLFLLLFTAKTDQTPHHIKGTFDSEIWIQKSGFRICSRTRNLKTDFNAEISVFGFSFLPFDWEIRKTI